MGYQDESSYYLLSPEEQQIVNRLVDQIHSSLTQAGLEKEAKITAEGMQRTGKKPRVRVREQIRQSVQAIPTIGLWLNAGSSSLLLARTTHILVHQYNAAYADKRVLTLNENIGHTLLLLISLVRLFVNSAELARRANGASTRSRTDTSSTSGNKAVENGVTAAVIGLSVIENIRGHTLVKKRQFSKFGRAYGLSMNALAALQLGTKTRYARS